MNAFGVEICDGIGSAEMFHIYITNRPGDIKPGSLGRIVEGYEAKIVDADGNEVADRRDGNAEDQRRLSRALLLERAREVERDFCRRLVHERATNFTSMRMVTTGITAALTTC